MSREFLTALLVWNSPILKSAVNEMPRRTA